MTPVVVGRGDSSRLVPDVVFLEDKSMVRSGNVPRLMASLTNLAISLYRIARITNIVKATRHTARNAHRALKRCAEQLNDDGSDTASDDSLHLKPLLCVYRGVPISVAAEIVGLGQQNLRLYERKGLLEPGRTDGGTRRYSENDLARLHRIAELLAPLVLQSCLFCPCRRFSRTLVRNPVNHDG